MIAVPPIFSSSPTAEMQSRAFLGQLVSGHTLRAYLAAVQHFSDWCTACGIKNLMSVDIEAARKYAERCAVEYSASTVKQRIVCLRKLFETLSEEGLAQSDVFEHIAAPKKPKQHPAATAPSDDVLIRMIETVGGASMTALRDRALLALMSASFVPVRTLC